ncbi:hypothetical protein ACJZ2D_001695 [Fusarium nematophilum]
MLPCLLLRSLLWVAGAILVSASPSFFHTRSFPGRSKYDTWRAIRRTFAASALERRDIVQENRTSLDTSWEDAVLFTYTAEQDLDTKQGNTSLSAGIEITCTTCYIKGIAKTRFIHDPDFNVTDTFDNFIEEVGEEFRSLATEAVDYVEEYIDSVRDNTEDVMDLDDFDLPPPDFAFDIDLPEIPDFRLQFEFDDLEVYMLIDTVLSAGATYTLNLYTSSTAIGFVVSDDIELGVIFTIDLILSVEGEIDVSSGFHLKLDDGVAIDIALFSEHVSSITFNGGEFEFLPVTVESAGVVFKAVLRVGVQAGLEIASPGVSISGKEVLKVGAGAEVGVFANIAEFITNVTLSRDEDDTACSLRVAEAYRLAIGAVAGASVIVGENTWGPVPETEIPIFYTTLADVCAIQRTGGETSTAQTVTETQAIKARDEDDDEVDMETTTISTEATFVVVACRSEGLVNCPASLQTTSKFSTTRTLVTVIPADSEATFPKSVRNTVASTIPFGNDAKKLAATSGTPRSYVPPSPTSSAKTDGSDDEEQDENSTGQGKTGGVSDSVIIGVSVGLGVPVLLGSIATAL